MTRWRAFWKGFLQGFGAAGLLFDTPGLFARTQRPPLCPHTGFCAKGECECFTREVLVKQRGVDRWQRCR